MLTYEKEMLIYMCAIWLYKARRRDATSIRLWAQILDCSVNKLDTKIKSCELCARPISAKPCTDQLMKDIWGELKTYTTFQTKHAFDTARKGEDNEKKEAN